MLIMQYTVTEALKYTITPRHVSIIIQAGTQREEDKGGERRGEAGKEEGREERKGRRV